MPAHLPRIKARLSIHAHRKVRGLLEGEYASLQTGRSMDFNDLREYVRGDDVKDLDWKASARTGTLLVKRYVAIRQHTVLLAVSTGRSMAAMNDAQMSKRELAVFVAGVFGWLAVRHGDLAGTAYGDSGRTRGLPPAGNEACLERALGLVHDATTPDAAPSAIVDVLDHVARTVRRRTILVVICDDYALTDRLESALWRCVVQHEVLLVSIGDLDPTRAAHGPVVDVDRHAAVPDWARGDADLAREYADLVAAESERLRQGLDRLGVVHERVADHDSAVRAIFRLLDRHRHARR